jgi:two-component system, OmpR family, sensor histidine kinase KdpD
MTSDPTRPDPDALLAAIHADEARAARGRLKVFFGFSPGVGKTYAMLASARSLAAAGTDVVVGIVETHGRAETAALVEGLEVLPRLAIPYRGHTLREFDLGGALARRPQVLIVDEMAHTNAPGSLHPKRWQDIDDLVAAGIDVHTALNVQHVESLVDLVEQATGVRVRETVPDEALDRADEIELVDLPPDELLDRLKAGKIYLPDVAARATERFFKRSNLLELRELALRRMTQRVDRDVESARLADGKDRGRGISERILVAVGPGPAAERILRKAHHIASGLRGEWIAATVDKAGLSPLAPAAVEQLERNLRLAESLGGSVTRLSGASIADALLQEAHRLRATRILVGKPRQQLRGAWFKENVVDRLVRHSHDIDVLVVCDEDEPRNRFPPPATGSSGRSLAGLGYVVGTLAATTVVGRLLWPHINDAIVSFVSLLIVLTSSLWFGRRTGVLAVVLAALVIDFFFVPPFFTLVIARTTDIVSLILLLSVGLVVAELIVRLKAQTSMAVEREQRTARLLRFSRALALALDADSIAATLASSTAAVTDASAIEVHLARRAEGLQSAARLGALVPAADEEGLVSWVVEHGRDAGLGTDTLPGVRITCLPIRYQGQSLGVLVIAFDPPRPLSREEHDILAALIDQTAVTLKSLKRR